MSLNRSSLLTVVVLSVALLVGCRSDSKQKHKTRSAKGTVTRIDLPNNSVSMKIQNPKTGKELEVAGTFTAETEIWINGVKKGPGDVEINDEIRVEYQRDGDELETRFVVTKADVTRAEGWKSTKPANVDPGKVPMQGATKADLIRSDQKAEHDDGGSAPPVDPRLAVPPTSTSPADRAAKEAEVTDLIFTEIKRRFDEAVSQRADMLKAGKPATDPEVLEKERIIRKARSLMMERGMNVAPVEPPLPDEPPTTQSSS